MDCKYCNRENTNYSCILRGNRVFNVCAVSVDKSQKEYDKQNYQVKYSPNGACEQLIER